MRSLPPFDSSLVKFTLTVKVVEEIGSYPVSAPSWDVRKMDFVFNSTGSSSWRLTPLDCSRGMISVVWFPVSLCYYWLEYCWSIPSAWFLFVSSFEWGTIVAGVLSLDTFLPWCTFFGFVDVVSFKHMALCKLRQLRWLNTSQSALDSARLYVQEDRIQSHFQTKASTGPCWIGTKG